MKVRHGTHRGIRAETAMPAHRHGYARAIGLAHLLMGSVAEYVVRYSRVPVLTVRNIDSRGRVKI